MGIYFLTKLFIILLTVAEMLNKLLDEWFKIILPKISNVESNLLIQYILILLNDRKVSKRKLKKNCMDNLKEFLNFNTTKFVENLFNKLSIIQKIQENKNQFKKLTDSENFIKKNQEVKKNKIFIKNKLEENGLKNIFKTSELETKNAKNIGHFLESNLIGFLTGICPMSNEFTFTIYNSAITLFGVELHLSNLTTSLLIPDNSKIHEKLQALINEDKKLNLQEISHSRQIRQNYNKINFKRTTRQLYLRNLPDLKDLITTISIFFSKFGTIDIIRIS